MVKMLIWLTLLCASSSEISDAVLGRWLLLLELTRLLSACSTSCKSVARALWEGLCNRRVLWRSFCFLNLLNLSCWF